MIHSATKPKATCRYVTGYGHYLFGEHELNCRDQTCAGCQPCTHDELGNLVRHCTCGSSPSATREWRCNQHLDISHPSTCPRCIGKVRENITWIIRHVDLLPAAAIENNGVRSEAAFLAGPAADPFVLTHRRVEQLRAGLPAEELDPEDPHHPFLVLGRWEVMLREHYKQAPTPLTGSVRPLLHQVRITRFTDLDRAAGYLLAHLTTAAQDDGIDWSQLNSEISVCRSHIEDVLNTARRSETGAPCPTCATLIKGDQHAPRLIKRLAEHTDLTAVYAGRACELGQQTDPVTGRSQCPVCRGDEDTWHCPDVADHSWTNPDYRDRVDDDYLRNASALTATDLQIIYGINPSTLRTWVQREHVKTRGRNTSGRKLYDVQQSIAMQKQNPTSTEETA